MIHLDTVMGRSTIQARGRFKISLLFVVMITFVLATFTISYSLTSYYHKSSLIAGVTSLEKRHYVNIKTWEDFSPVKSTQKAKIIIYNRVGKCGSRTMIQLMISLTGKLNYTVIGSTMNSVLHLNLREQLEFVDFIDHLHSPVVYHHHIHFVDFKRFGAVQPIHINLIRDPLARLVSSYYFHRFGDHREAQRTWGFKGTDEEKNMTFDECVKNELRECVDPQKILYIIPYFCGHEAFCRRPTELALRQAKINVIRNYLVVGVTEELEDFLSVLEKLLPEFFAGVLNMYKTPDEVLDSKMTSTKTVNKKGPSPEVQEIMKKHLQLEYDFYEFVKVRFHRLKAELR